MAEVDARRAELLEQCSKAKEKHFIQSKRESGKKRGQKNAYPKVEEYDDEYKGKKKKAKALNECENYISITTILS